MRPEFITEEDIARWEKNYEEGTRKNPEIPSFLLDSPIIREVCYAGMWLAEELTKLGCADDMITRIQFTAGRMSFGRDPWAVAQQIMGAYRGNELNFENEPETLN